MHNYSDLKHCFFIRCDSLGIQLLIKDILKIDECKSIHAEAQLVVKAFRKAPLQYARLRKYQIQGYGEARSLVLSIITRWGTQYRLFVSLECSKAAIKRYALNHNADDLAQGAYDYITSPIFWNKNR